MSIGYQNLAIVIPALNPTEILISYVRELMAKGFAHIYIVNDGSDETYAPIFRSISVLEACTLLTHPHNRGKGATLKTAYYHISENFPLCRGIITADADGQHAVKDVCKIADGLLNAHGGLFLGGRTFSRKKVPLKSLIGNRITSLAFFLLHGTWVQDTQTGLRGFDISLLPEMCNIKGERFEYEMTVLTTCTNKKIPIHFISIDTIYINGNAGSHFRAVADSLRIGRILLSDMCRFLFSSGLSSVIDISLCWIFLYVLAGVVPTQLLRIGLSVVMARVISMVVNYAINKTYVFHATGHKNHPFGRYLLLAIANMIALTALIYGGHSVLGIGERLMALIANFVLFFANYQIQNRWVFSSNN